MAWCAEGAATDPPTSIPASVPPTTRAALAVPLEEQGFDPAEHLLADPFALRSRLFAHGIDINPYLIVDYSKVFLGGINTRSDSFRERFNLPLLIDTEKLLGWHGGEVTVIYQLQHGANASHTLTGDAQNFSFGTDADGRSQIGQLWYEQKLMNDTLRIRAGKLDANADFDVMDNAQEFLNNSFQTSPTLALMPSFPDTGTGVQVFVEPHNGFYAGTGVFDGSGARGVHTGEYGPKHFFDRPSDVFLIAEVGARYKFPIGVRRWPGKLAVGGWYDPNHLPTVDGTGISVGTGGAYLVFDQLLWRPYRQRPVPAGPPGATPSAQPQEEEYPGGVAMSASASWAEPLANRIDANGVVAFNWTGPIPQRDIDVLGLGVTYAHFSHYADVRDDYELAIESFYRARLTRWISLKPDLQYIVHPNGSGPFGEPIRHDALVATFRLEVSF